MPFADASFDVVFCDHGAMTFADPYALVPEVGAPPAAGRPVRLLSHSTPFAGCAGTTRRSRWSTGCAPDTSACTGTTSRTASSSSNLPYGEWIRLFRAHGFAVEALIEMQPPDGAASTYRGRAETAWARRWPIEEIWKVRKWS